MKRELIQTGDGSWTIQLPEWNEQYHSKHGAIAEAQHVFIQSGLVHFTQKNKAETTSILEIGFGTGLNALLSYQYAQQNDVKLDYSAMEAFPVAEEEWSKLNYAEAVGLDFDSFSALHKADWEVMTQIHPNFSLLKQQQTFDKLDDVEKYDLIYYDAFGPRVQPELWHIDLLKNTFEALKPDGVWVSYCAKGDVRRDLQELGFEVERLPGPPGKRHMLRATKPS